MRVGISLLTLVPGAVGGSETYARALTQALANVGTLRYTALLPPVAADAHGGLPSRMASGYPAVRTAPERARAMAGAALAHHHFHGASRRCQRSLRKR